MQANAQVLPMTNTSAPPAKTTPAALPATKDHRTIFVPVLLIALAFVAWLGFQTEQLMSERQQLGLAQAGQEPQVQAATKLRVSLEGMAAATAKLAADGNGNARVIVEELRKRGVTINAAATATPP